MQIRSYQPTDRSACVALFQSNVPTYFDPTELADFETWLNGQEQRQLAYRNTAKEEYFVVELNGQVVACGGYYLAANSPCASMTWGMVHRNLHRQGMGSALFRHRLQQIAQAAPHVTIGLDTTQHSYPFFQRFGFTITKHTPNGYAPGMHRYDMELTPEALAAYLPTQTGQ